MAKVKVVHRVVRHEGGWVHQANGALSQTFRTREEAREAARVATREQQSAKSQSPKTEAATA